MRILVVITWVAAMAHAVSQRPATANFSPNVPPDLPAKPTQAAAVKFAWLSFVALNWPALPSARGVPDTSRQIGAPGVVVWQTWKLPEEVFLADGSQPAAWNTYSSALPSICKSDTGVGAQAGDLVLSQISKVSSNTNGNNSLELANEVIGGSLTDQHGNLARYEIRFNKTQFDGIVLNRFYNVQGQNAARVIQFPAGVMEIKASWRQFTAADTPEIRSRFLQRQAWIYTPASGSQPASCYGATVGLTGLHITQKTPTRPQWIWATFEQVDNVPPFNSAPPPGRKLPYSFNDPSCSVTECPPNQSTEDGRSPSTPTQVTRIVNIGAAARVANAQWQAALANTPFQYLPARGRAVAAEPDAASRREPGARAPRQHDDGDLRGRQQLHPLPLHGADTVRQALVGLHVRAHQGTSSHGDTMSVLAFPRINFRGVFRTNPCTLNNDDVMPAVVNRDSDTLGGTLAGMTDAQIEAYLREQVSMSNQPGLGCINFIRAGWNLYGDFTTSFDDTAVTSIVYGPAASQRVTSPAQDPLIGRAVQLLGSVTNDPARRGSAMICDLDPTGLVTTQLWVGGLQIDSTMIDHDTRAFQNWLNFASTVGAYNGEQNFVGIGCTWQFAIPASALPVNAPVSPGLQSLLSAARQAAGLVVRFRTFEVQPELRDEQMYAQFQQGQAIDNPSLGYLVGTIGIWEQGEPETEVAGRKLTVPYKRPAMAWQSPDGQSSGSVPGAPQPWGAPPALIGNAVACVQGSASVISLDLVGTFPKFGFRDPDGPGMPSARGFGAVKQMANVGNVQLGVIRVTGGPALQIATIDYGLSDYSTYEDFGGIVDLPFDPQLSGAIATGTLVVKSTTAPNANVQLLEETTLRVVTDDRTMLLDAWCDEPARARQGVQPRRADRCRYCAAPLREPERHPPAVRQQLHRGGASQSDRRSTRQPGQPADTLLSCHRNHPRGAGLFRLVPDRHLPDGQWRNPAVVRDEPDTVSVGLRRHRYRCSWLVDSDLQCDSRLCERRFFGSLQERHDPVAGRLRKRASLLLRSVSGDVPADPAELP